MTKIQVVVRKQYGNDVIYPHCDAAKALCAQANTKTITRMHLATLKASGMIVESMQGTWNGSVVEWNKVGDL